jgi:CheY-like chemotaxis protein
MPTPRAGIRSSTVQNLGLHVLLADDTPTNQTLTRRLLAHLGCTCDLASNGNEALARLAAGRYDIVLMDGQMPDLDGLEATIRWRAKEQAAGLARTPIIALTALALEGDRDRFLAAGADGYLAKPFTIDELATVLRRWRPSGNVDATTTG